MQEDSKELQSDMQSDCAEKNLTDVSLPNSEAPSSPSPSDDGEAFAEEAFEPTAEDTSVSLDVPYSETDGGDSGEPTEAIESETSVAQTVLETAGATVRKGIVKTKWMVIACVSAFVLGVGGAVGALMWINEIKDPWRVESGLMDYGDFSSQSASSDQIVIPGYGDILLEADTRDVMLILPNPASNPCYFRFTIVLEESGETVYSSGLVPPGKAIQSLKLKRAFEVGDYPAVIRIESFSLDKTRTPMNGANVETVLNFR